MFVFKLMWLRMCVDVCGFACRWNTVSSSFLGCSRVANLNILAGYDLDSAVGSSHKICSHSKGACPAGIPYHHTAANGIAANEGGFPSELNAALIHLYICLCSLNCWNNNLLNHFIIHHSSSPTALFPSHKHELIVPAYGCWTKLIAKLYKFESWQTVFCERSFCHPSPKSFEPNYCTLPIFIKHTNLNCSSLLDYNQHILMLYACQLVYKENRTSDPHSKT